MAGARKLIKEPELKDLMDELRNEIFDQMNCVKIGKIVSFDATKKTASIQLLFKKNIPGRAVSYPLMVDCPVFTLQGGGGSVRFPITAGDNCIVLFSDRNIDNWFMNGAENTPNTERTHNLSDGIALVGVNSLVSTLEEYKTDEVRLSFSNTRLAIKGGQANIQNATTSLLEVLTLIINGIQGATFGGYPMVDATGKIASALTKLNALLYKD